MNPFEFGVIGLGKMGGSLSIQASRQAMRVVGFSEHVRNPEELVEAGVEIVSSLDALVAALSVPRKIFLYVPAGRAVDEVIASLTPILSRGDIIIDAGNSHFRDSAVRYELLKGQGLGFIDCGSSGGPIGALTGACFMIGGDVEHVELLRPILEKLAVPGGYLHTGPAGSGHFVKLVHNAIEFGMLQSIGEGMALLKSSDYPLELPKIFHNWSKGSVIRGWLVELMEKGLRENPDLAKVPSYIEDTGEVNWAVEEGIRKQIPLPIITQSVLQLFSSRQKDESRISEKSVAILRHEFGGHPFGPDPAIAAERETSHLNLKKTG